MPLTESFLFGFVKCGGRCPGATKIFGPSGRAQAALPKERGGSWAHRTPRSLPCLCPVPTLAADGSGGSGASAPWMRAQVSARGRPLPAAGTRSGRACCRPPCTGLHTESVWSSAPTERPSGPGQSRDPGSQWTLRAFLSYVPESGETGCQRLRGERRWLLYGFISGRFSCY